MPRFDREGFNPEKRIANDSRDRSVPDDENYYNGFGFDDVRDNQKDMASLIDDFDYSNRQKQQQSNYTYVDEDEERRKWNEKNAQRIRQSNVKSKRTKRNNPRKKENIGKKILLGIVAVVLVFTIGVGAFVGSTFSKITYDDKRDNQYVNLSALTSSSKVKNILLLGVDARQTDDDNQSRSDAMMLVSIDSEHKCIKMVSFLRDSWVYIPSMDQKQRLNAACSSDGYNGVVDTIEYNFGIDIDGYVVADFEMFKVLVDSIGGVEVEVSQEEADEVNNHEYRYDYATLESGTHTLTGEQALAYCRIRKIDTDFMRAYRQRTVMQSILKGVKSANPLKLVSMASKCAPYIETNLSKFQIMSIALSALSCISTMVETRVPFDDTWSYQTISGNSVISVDIDKNKSLLIDYIYNKSAEEIKAESN